MVEMMTGKEIQPTCRISVMLRPKPNKITAHCKIFLDVNPMPAPVFPFPRGEDRTDNYT